MASPLEQYDDPLRRHVTELFGQEEPTTPHLNVPTHTEIAKLMIQEENILTLEKILRTRIGEIAAIPQKSLRARSEKPLNVLFEEDIRLGVERILNTQLPKEVPLTRWDGNQTLPLVGTVISGTGVAVSLSSLGTGFSPATAGLILLTGTATMCYGSMLWHRLQESYSYAQFESMGNLVKQYIYHGHLSNYPVRATIAHEAVHTAQKQRLRWDQKENRAFMEGMAIGVEREFLIEDCKEDAKGVRHMMDTRLSGLMKVYTSLSSILNRSQDEKIIEAHEKHRYYSTSCEVYGLGDALFAIAEAKHGPGIYAEALRDPRVVLE